MATLHPCKMTTVKLIRLQLMLLSRSGLGKLFGSMCAVAGVLVLSLPIPIIAANFERFHKNHQAGEKAKKRKALLVSNKKRNERNRIDYLDRVAHDHYRTCKLASVLTPRN